MGYEHQLRISVPQTEHVAVLGEAKIEVVPDIVELTLELTKVAGTIAIAKEDIDTRAGCVIAVSKALGIAANDITASELICGPKREYRRGEMQDRGYSAERTIKLKLRDLARFNALTSELVNVPVDRLQRVEQQIADRSAADRKAMEVAIADAKNKAQFLAEQFGASLGRVYSLQVLPKIEQFHIGSATAEVTDDGATFQPGTIVVESLVAVTFYLAPPP